MVCTTSPTQLQGLLEELACKHNVPGAAIALLDGDEITQAATGLTNKSTGVAVTTNTLFQIGSITKVWTATLAMQLVDEGKVELDQVVRTYLPELKFADSEATDSITVRQLLSHAGGLDDNQLDTGRGDDCLSKYVESCASLPQVAPPGTVLSYSNPGFRVAGRLIERVIGQTWNAALKERLLEPMGTKRTVTLPEEAILHRTAVGHIDPANSGDLTPTPIWHWPRSSGPSGGIISTASELLSFAGVHLDDGVTASGKTVLSTESVRAMQEQQADSPDKWSVEGWGLGWMLLNWDGYNVIGHDGGGVGQIAFLRVVPEIRFAVALLTNGWNGTGLSSDLFKRVFAERAGIKVPDLPKPADHVEFDPSRYAGTYHGSLVQIRVEAQDGGLIASMEWGGTPKGLLSALRGEPLKPVDEKTFLIDLPYFEEGTPFVFFDFDESGCPRYIHWGGRAHPRAIE